MALFASFSQACYNTELILAQIRGETRWRTETLVIRMFLCDEARQEQDMVGLIVSSFPSLDMSAREPGRLLSASAPASLGVRGA